MKQQVSLQKCFLRINKKHHEKNICLFIGGILLTCQFTKAYDFRIDGVYYQIILKI